MPFRQAGFVFSTRTAAARPLIVNKANECAVNDVTGNTQARFEFRLEANTKLRWKSRQDEHLAAKRITRSLVKRTKKKPTRLHRLSYFKFRLLRPVRWLDTAELRQNLKYAIKVSQPRTKPIDEFI